jgi:Siphovirus Gp157
MATELVKSPACACTLYELEDNLQALANSIALAEEEPTRQLILDEIGQALRKTKEKRDTVVAFLRHCELQQKFADAEIERIGKRKAFIASVEEQLESYVVQLIEQFAPPDRKGVQRLEGNISSMRIQKNPDSVLITDLNSIPPAYKHVTLTMPAYVWEALLNSIGLDDRKEFESRVEKAEYRPDKKAIGGELKNGAAIDGADLKFGGHRLVIS